MSHTDDSVPKQCPFRRSTFWYLICCATCLGSRDNSKYHSYPHTWPKSDFHRLFDSGFAPSALRLRLNKHTCPEPVFHRLLDSGFVPLVISLRLNNVVSTASNLKYPLHFHLFPSNSGGSACILDKVHPISAVRHISHLNWSGASNSL